MESTTSKEGESCFSSTASGPSSLKGALRGMSQGPLLELIGHDLLVTAGALEKYSKQSSDREKLDSKVQSFL